MIDLHCHLLHGLDDGPATLEESLELCRIAVEDGVTHAVVTPHIYPGRWDNSREGIQRRFHCLKSALLQSNIPLHLGFAGEVRLTDQIMRQISDNGIPFYGEVKGYKIMLLEFPHGQIIPGSDKLVGWLLKQNIRPLIAHPERNRQVMKDPAQLHPFLEMGCWLQLTAGAVLGDFGERAQEIARQLLRDGAIKVIASDGHNTRARQPRLKQAFATICAEYGQERALDLMHRNPATIIASQFEEQVFAQ